MAKYNPFNPVEPDKRNPFNAITSPNEFKFDVDEQNFQIGPRIPKTKDPFGLPRATLSQGDLTPQKDSIWTNIAKTLLPKKAEDFFGLNDTSQQKLMMEQEKTREKEKKQEIFSKSVENIPAFRAMGDKNYETTIAKKTREILNHPNVKPVMEATARRLSGTGLYSTIQSSGPKTFIEAYKANKQAQAGDTSTLNQFLYQLGDTAPQALIGVALNFVPYLGKPLATAYWTALSADEQIQKTGSVTSLGNIGIDVGLDRVLGGTIESLFKKPVKSLVTAVKKAFVAEGGTEVTQDILKMANDYRNAPTGTEKQAALQAGKDYFTSGQVLMTAGVGGLTGAGIGAGAYALNKYNPELSQKISEAADKNIPVPESIKNMQPGLSIKDVSGVKPEEIKSNDFNIPTTKSSALGFIELETPVAMAVEATSQEGTVSSGFHASQTPQRWKIIYNQKEVTPKLLKAAQQAGLEINVREAPVGTGHFLTELSLPNVKMDEIDKAKRAFDSFADIYSSSKQDKQDLWEDVEPLPRDSQGPGYQKLVDFVDKMEQNGTIHPEEAPIIKALFENTNDDFLKVLNLAEDGRLLRTPGYFRISKNKSTGMFLPETNLLKIRKGLTLKTGTGALSTFFHEYGHAGYYLILSESERAQVEEIYNNMTKAEQKALFSHFPDRAQKYYAKNVQEFWAQSFTDYVMENKVSEKQLEPLLKRISKKFFEVLKQIINRSNPQVINPMKPLFEMILDGNWDSPLTEYVKKEPPSFKSELQALLKRVAPEASAQAEKAEVQKPLFTGSKEPTTNIPVRKTKELTSPPPLTIGGGTVDGIRTREQVEGKSPEVTHPVEEEIQKGNTPLEKRVRRTDLLRTPWKVLDKIGLREPYQTLLKSFEAYTLELPGNIDKITAWSKRVSKASNERIFRFLDGEAIELDANEAQVAEEIKTWLSQWADRLGMAPDARISEYITHIFPIDSKGEIPEELAVLINKKVAKSVYNPFLLQRQGAEGYIKDTWKALDAYTKRATRKVNMDPALEAFDEASKKLTDVSQLNYVERFISRVNMRPTEQEVQWDNEIKSRFGYFFGNRPVNSITRLFRQMISRAKIGGSLTSFAKNLTQGVNTFAELGTRYTLKGYLSLLKKGAAAELKENNVLMGSFIEDRTYSAIKKAAEIADKVLFLNMQASENVNRGAAYFGAKAKFLNGKVKPREFREALGRNMPANYQPTMEDAIEYGKFVAGKTQFRFDPLETPMALSSDIARTAAQFQTFGLKQAEFILGMVKDREIVKLFRYFLSSMLLFAYIGGAFGMSWDDSFKTLRWGYPPALQFLIDLWKGGITGEDKYGNELDAGQRARMVGKSLFTNIVPAGAQMQRTFEGIGAVSEGKSRTKSGRFEYKIDQTPQNYIRGALFGKYNLPQAQEYYKNKDKDKVKTKMNRNPFDPI